MAVNLPTDLSSRVRRAAMRGIIRGTESVRNEAISLVLNTPKTGRVHRRGGVEHQASAPGEPFASDTGETVNSIRTEYNFNDLSGHLLTNENGARLELGTAKMEPRPFLRPALANKQGEIEQFIQEEIAKEFK